MPIYRDPKTGSYVYQFNRVVDGKRIRAKKRLPKGWNRAKAEKYDEQETAKILAVARGLEGGESSIDEAVALYIEERVPQLKSGRNTALELVKFSDWYIGEPLSRLAEVCRDYALNGRAENGNMLAPATIKNRIRYLTAACRYAWKAHGICEHDPAERVTVPQVRNERKVFISRAEMLCIAKACKNRNARAAIRIAFYSGMRISEICRRRIVGDFFVLDDTKNGDSRAIPIHPRLRCIASVEMPTRYIISYQYRAARKEAGLEHVNFHDLRHSAASAMINAGIDLKTIGEILGHRSHASTNRYTHLLTGALVNAIGAIGKKAA